MSNPADPKANRVPNRLIDETSPYLRQHAYNPVEWYAWGDESLAKAKREAKPIFLSIGYSACHWCHVMERESFENQETAALMNEWFVNIKVDREERPDLDHIYMSAVQMMTQHGGWPMSVFLTPEGQPFYGGTYFPPEDRMGMPSFKKILGGVANAWKTRKEEILKTAGQLSTALGDLSALTPENERVPLSLSLVDKAVDKMAHHFDPQFGGFGNAPKFFHTMDLRLFLRHAARTGDAKSQAIVSITLDRLLNGGIYDQLGGGFHRYSTDREWLVPHFEKMLYDNALLAETYLEAYQANLKEDWSRIAHETLNYVLKEMTSPEGAFYSTQDADSEGVEGKFYVWKQEEIESLLDQDVAQAFNLVYDVSASGNWEENNILNRKASLTERAAELKVDRVSLEDTLALAMRKLLAHRGERIAPHRDEKILTSWNGLMIQSMALGAQVLNDDRYLAAATKAADFMLTKLKREGDTLLLFHTYKDGWARLNGYLDDYANLMNGLITLFETDGNPRWLKEATRLAESILDQFFDVKENSFFFTPREHETLITRPREMHDGATPSATAIAITALARLGLVTGKSRYLQRAEAALAVLSKQMEMIPQATAQCLIALELLFSDPMEWVFFAGDDADENAAALQAMRKTFTPNKVTVLATAENAAELTKLTELTDGRNGIDGKATLYVCRKSTCLEPLVGQDAILAFLQKLR